MSAATTIKVRVRLPGGRTCDDVELAVDVPWLSVLLHLESLSGIAHTRLRVLRGYPPKAIDVPDDAPVRSLALRDRDTLIVQEGEARVVGAAATGQRYARPVSERAHLVRRRCPADNSCLFHACAYVLQDKSRSGGAALRLRCVEHILTHPHLYNQQTIGQSTEAYAAWLRRSDAWGGAIELQILSELFTTELIALDLESTTMQRFGSEAGYSVRAFVVYTGTHFDCIAMNPHYNSDNERDDQVLFNPHDATILERARRFVREEGEQLRKDKAQQQRAAAA